MKTVEEINKRKWHNKLKSIFNSKLFDWYKMHGEGGRGTSFALHDQSIYPKTWKDMFKTKDGIAYKETSTMWHNPKTEKDDYSDAKMMHKRDVANKSLSKEDQEELNEYLGAKEKVKYPINDTCYACKNFMDEEKCLYWDKVNSGTNWKKFGCEDFTS